MADRPRVPNGVKLADPPESTDEGAFWDRVLELRHTGMPWSNASRLARSEALGLREVDGALKHRPRRLNVRRIRNERGERLDRDGNVVPNPMPPMKPAA